MLNFGSVPHLPQRTVRYHISIGIFQLFWPLGGIAAENKHHIAHYGRDDKYFRFPEFPNGIIKITNHRNRYAQPQTQQGIPAKNKSRVLLIFQNLPEIDGFCISPLVFHRRFAQLVLFLPGNIGNTLFLVLPHFLVIVRKLHGVFIVLPGTFHLTCECKHSNNGDQVQRGANYIKCVRPQKYQPGHCDIPAHDRYKLNHRHGKIITNQRKRRLPIQ